MGNYKSTVKFHPYFYDLTSFSISCIFVILNVCTIGSPHLLMHWTESYMRLSRHLFQWFDVVLWNSHITCSTCAVCSTRDRAVSVVFLPNSMLV